VRASCTKEGGVSRQMCPTEVCTPKKNIDHVYTSHRHMVSDLGGNPCLTV
jgi:hypothetical protein